MQVWLPPLLVLGCLALSCLRAASSRVVSLRFGRPRFQTWLRCGDHNPTAHQDKVESSGHHGDSNQQCEGHRGSFGHRKHHPSVMMCRICGSCTCHNNRQHRRRPLLTFTGFSARGGHEKQRARPLFCLKLRTTIRYERLPRNSGAALKDRSRKDMTCPGLRRVLLLPGF
jgi:hypothetical protein